MFDLFEFYFWEVATASVKIIVPVIVIMILFGLLKSLLFDRD